MKSLITKWITAGAAAGALLGGADILSLLLLAKNMFLGTEEMARALLFCFTINTMSGALLGLVGATVIIALVPLSKKIQFITVSAILSGLFILLFHMLTTGPQASVIPGRHIVVVILGILTGTSVSLGIFWGAAQSKKRTRFVLLATCILGSIAFITADLFIMVRLYLPFHIALSIASWLLLTMSMLLVWKGTPAKWMTVVSIVMLCGLSAAGLFSLMQVRRTQNTRFVLNEKTAHTSDVLLAAKALIPPAEQYVLDEEPDEATADTRPVSNAVSIKRPGASILFITIDAMRYDRLRPGDSTGAAPTLNQLAATSTVFKRAYTALPHTSYAVASFLTGKYIKPLFEIPEVTADQETWAEIMRRFRYRTGGFFTRSVFFIDREKFKPLENKGYGFGYLKMEYRFTAGQKVDQAIEFLSKIKDKNNPMFTWVHLFEPHEPYKPECTRFGTDDEQRYDCEIYTADQQVKRLLDYVEEYFPETIIVAAADHGEEFNDHGGKYHGTTLYDEQVRVPLLIRVPGVAHREVNEPVNMVDIVGTMLSIVDIPIPPRVRSNDLSGLILGMDTEKKAAFSQLHEQRMVVFDEHKLIWDQSSDLVRLYDLKKDPKETVSIADQNPEMVALLKQKIASWEAAHAKTELRPVTTADGVQSWPVPVQKALGGDTASANALPAFLTDETPEIIRRKAAQLLYEMWQYTDKSVDASHITDPICLTWLWSARADESPEDAIRHLRILSDELPPHSVPWTRASLVRLRLGDDQATSQVIEIALQKENAPAVRIEAIQTLGNKHIQSAETALLETLELYQLRLAAAAALAKLKSTKAIAPILRHLQEEPFISRRNELTRALVAIEGPKSIKTVLTQLLHEKPIPDGIALLREMGAFQKSPQTIRIPSATVSIVGGTSLRVPSRPGHLIFTADSSLQSVEILCNERNIASLNALEPGVPQSVSLKTCPAGKSADTTITLLGEPDTRFDMLITH